MVKTTFLIAQMSVYMLAKIINAECANCELKEMLLVGSVIVNRVNDPRFPKTINSVIEQKNQFHGITHKNYELSAQSLKAASQIIMHGPINDEILYFYLKDSKKSKKKMRNLKIIYEEKYHNFCK